MSVRGGNYTYARLRDYRDRFTLIDEIIGMIEALPNPSAELVMAVDKLKGMRAELRAEAVNYLEAPFKPEPVWEEP